MIDLIQTELESGTYSSDDVAALAELKAVEQTVYGVFTSNKMREFLSKENLYIDLKKLADRSHDIYLDATLAQYHDAIHNASSATLDTINAGQPSDFASDYVRGSVPMFVSIGFFTQAQCDECLGLGTTIVHPFESATLRLVKMARGTVPATSDLAWNRQRYLKITLNSDLPEPVSVSLTKTTDLWTDEPVGRSKVVEKAGSYIIDLLGAQDAGTLTVNLWISEDFTCELI